MRRRAARGRLIALEGIDGTGKSTLQRRLARRWRAAGWKVALAREPNDRRLGAQAQAAGVVDPWSSGLLFTLDRLAARSRVESLLAVADLVVMDRSFYSTLAYQGSALPPTERRMLERLQREATIVPDRVVLLDLPPAQALSRVGRRGRSRAPLERLRTLRRVAGAYRALARAPRWVVVDARAPPDRCEAEVARRLSRWLGRPPAARPPPR